MIGAVLMGLIGLRATAPAFVSSARHFAQCFEGIQDTSKALSPMERVVFGLALASSDDSKQVRDAEPAPRI